MSITLKPEQEDWLQALVERGEFTSVEEAARQMLDQRIAEIEIAQDDLAWAKPLVDEGLAQIERGETVSLQENRRFVAELLDRLKRK